MAANIYIQILFIFVIINVPSNIRSYNHNEPKIFEPPSTVPPGLKRYDPNWESLDTRPLPQWYDDAKIGIFLHWGVFSVPSFGSEWFWNAWKNAKNKKDVEFMQKNYPPGFTYQEFAKDFTAEFFDPDEWAELFRQSGAKYVVLTSKHHEGFTLWPSKYSFGWNAGDVGPHRDLIGDLAKAVRAKNLEFGLYHSLLEWFHPLYLSDKSALFLRQDFVKNKVLPEMYELVNKYEPSIVWSDGEWEAFDFYWNSTEFIAWLYNDSPVKDTVVVNDRWGIGIACRHGDFYTCHDKYNPGVLQPHKWENAMSIDTSSWGYRRNADLASFVSTQELIQTLTETVSCGGNILINIGPTKEGTIVPIFQERLLDLGSWLAVNGEAIYKSKPWKVQNDTLTSGLWYTTDSKKVNVYAIALNWPEKNLLKMKSAVELFSTSTTTVNLLGTPGKLKWILRDGFVSVQFPDRAIVTSDWAWVLKISQ